MVPLAPGRLSMTTTCPRFSVSFCPTMPAAPGIAGAMLLEKTRDPLLLLQRLGPPVLEDLEEVVSRIELRAETSPGAALDAEIQLAQFVGRHAHGDHVADAHHDVVRNDLHPFGRKHFPEAGLVQMSVDLVDRLGLLCLRTTVISIVCCAAAPWTRPKIAAAAKSKR